MIFDVILKELRAKKGDMNVFDDMGFYWAEIADQNQTEKQVQFIKKTLKVKGLVLDVACGTGRHLIPLSQSGCEVIGLDISAKLLRIAKSRWRDSQVVRGDMRFLPFKTRSVFGSHKHGYKFWIPKW